MVAMRNRKGPNLRLKGGDRRNDKSVSVPPLSELQSILLIEALSAFFAPCKYARGSAVSGTPSPYEPEPVRTDDSWVRAPGEPDVESRGLIRLRGLRCVMHPVERRKIPRTRGRGFASGLADSVR